MAGWAIFFHFLFCSKLLPCQATFSCFCLMKSLSWQFELHAFFNRITLAGIPATTALSGTGLFTTIFSSVKKRT